MKGYQRVFQIWAITLFFFKLLKKFQLSEFF